MQAEVQALKHPQFAFHRSRGIVWVCDIAGSSRALNDNESASAVEEFLPRLYWAARAIVEAAGGVFIKWTGDGFLAWFETPLHRNLDRTAWRVYLAAYHLTLLVNITHLNIESKRKFKLRHGITYEQDALITNIQERVDYTHSDIIGRAVVLAFRMSGVEADFPSIVTQKDLSEAAIRNGELPWAFVRWQPSADEKLRHFKGESWGTGVIRVSGQRKPRRISTKTIIRRTNNALEAAAGKRTPKFDSREFVEAFLRTFSAGDSWCEEVIASYTRFIQDELVTNLQQAVAALQKATDLRRKHG